MVFRNDFIEYLVDNLRFKHINGICLYSDSYLNAIVEMFNKLDYRKTFKYNNNLTLENAKFSLNCFFDNLNFGKYGNNFKLNGGVVTWIIYDNPKIIVGCNNDKSNYNNGKYFIDKEYLKEWENYGFYFYSE